MQGVCSIAMRMPRPLGFGTSTRELVLPRQAVAYDGFGVLHLLQRQPSMRRASGLFFDVPAMIDILQERCNSTNKAAGIQGPNSKWG